jgi:hypothetical protein
MFGARAHPYRYSSGLTGHFINLAEVFNNGPFSISYFSLDIVFGTVCTVLFRVSRVNGLRRVSPFCHPGNFSTSPGARP